MPELAEVDCYRRLWDCGVGDLVVRVHLNSGKRVFRGIDESQLVKSLLTTSLLGSESRGKQMLFRFSGNQWLGLHLGMTGELRVEAKEFGPQKHDHLVLYQRDRALVFSDFRQFGRVLYYLGENEPEWWSCLPPSLTSASFTQETITQFLRRHSKMPIKAALLLQDGFPGIGNWMADEILWRAALSPKMQCGHLNEVQMRDLWKTVRYVCRGALKHVKGDFSDLPKGWLFNERWSKKGKCPIHHTPLERESIGGRTTAWCLQCQGGSG